MLARCRFLAIATAVVVFADEPVIVDKQEILYLDQLADPSRWEPAEGTVAAADSQTPGKRNVLRFHIPVDHHAGEAKYPIGWPRMYCQLRPPAETGWSDWDRLEFDIHATMSEGALPKTPLNFQVLCPDRHQNNNHSLDQMKLGEWVTVSIPVHSLKHLGELARLGFNISESSYQDKVKLDFLIGGFRLLRSAECNLASLAVRPPVAYRMAEHLAVEMAVAGPPANVSRGIPFEIRQQGKVLRRETLPAQRGKRVVEMEIGELKLDTGDYELVAFPDDADRIRKATFRLVPAPWEGRR